MTGKQSRAFVYRLIYSEAHGPIPDGFTIDHLCGNGWCCRLDHLEAVSRSENSLRYATNQTLPLAGAKDISHYLLPA